MRKKVYHGPSKKEYVVLKALKAVGLEPVHQFEVPGTKFIADFCFPDKKLIVEVDGHPYHYTVKGRKYGKFRDKIIQGCGFKMLHLKRKVLSKDVSVVVEVINKNLRKQ